VVPITRTEYVPDAWYVTVEREYIKVVKGVERVQTRKDRWRVSPVWFERIRIGDYITRDVIQNGGLHGDE
jgi:hypothetical protein